MSALLQPRPSSRDWCFSCCCGPTARVNKNHQARSLCRLSSNPLSAQLTLSAQLSSNPLSAQLTLSAQLNSA